MIQVTDNFILAHDSTVQNSSYQSLQALLYIQYLHSIPLRFYAKIGSKLIYLEVDIRINLYTYEKGKTSYATEFWASEVKIDVGNKESKRCLQHVTPWFETPNSML